MLGILVKRGEMVINYWIGCQGALFSNKPTWEMVIWNVSNGDRMGNQSYRKCVIVHSQLWNDHRVYYGIIMRYWVLGAAVPLFKWIKKTHIVFWGHPNLWRWTYHQWAPNCTPKYGQNMGPGSWFPKDISDISDFPDFDEVPCIQKSRGNEWYGIYSQSLKPSSHLRSARQG